MKVAQPLWLASRSPRRLQMLQQLRIDLRVQPPDIDDAKLRPGRISPRQWVVALAYLKARRVAEMLLSSNRNLQGTVLGADTVCVTSKGEILGQPRDLAAARRMLAALNSSEHQTLTGVCLLDLASGTRTLFHDATRVMVGQLPQQAIDDYLASNQWRGKAGAYNLSERIDAGWPIQCAGDPDTVMGLPMQKLMPLVQGSLLGTRT